MDRIILYNLTKDIVFEHNGMIQVLDECDTIEEAIDWIKNY